MGEIRIVCPGKTRGYPYPVCKNRQIAHYQITVWHINSPLYESATLVPFDIRLIKRGQKMHRKKWSEFLLQIVDLL